MSLKQNPSIVTVYCRCPDRIVYFHLVYEWHGETSNDSTYCPNQQCLPRLVQEASSCQHYNLPLHCSSVTYTECPTRYRTRHFFNNFTTNEDIATKFEVDLPHCVRNVKEKNLLLFKFRCNIFIGVRIIKEMPGSVASGTLCSCVVV